MGLTQVLGVGGVVAGAGALGGLTGGAVGVGLGTLLGRAAGGFGGSIIIGAYSGAAGAGAAYGSSWLGLTVARGLGADVSTEGYSLAGMGQSMAMGGLVGGAMGGAYWGGTKLHNSLASSGNAAAEQTGRAAGESARRASEAASKSAQAPATTEPTALDVPETPKVPAPKPLPKAPPKTVAPQGPEADTPPPQAQEHQPQFDETLTGEREPWQTTQGRPGWNEEHSASWAKTNAAGRPTSRADAIGLQKQLASESQLAELRAGRGEPIAGPGTRAVLKDEARLISEYGGRPGEWLKVSSSNFKA